MKSLLALVAAGLIGLGGLVGCADSSGDNGNAVASDDSETPLASSDTSDVATVASDDSDVSAVASDDDATASSDDSDTDMELPDFNINIPGHRSSGHSGAVHRETAARRRPERPARPAHPAPVHRPE